MLKRVSLFVFSSGELQIDSSTSATEPAEEVSPALVLQLVAAAATCVGGERERERNHFFSTEPIFIT